MEPRQADLKAIFCEALGRPAGPDRRAYLERACGDDPALRDQVEELLAAHDRAGGLLNTSPGTAADEDATRADSSTAAARVPGLSATDGDAADDATGPPTAASPPTRRTVAEGPGSRIGPYMLLQEIGQGGMGTVFMAEQDKPVRRRVALKVIKAGMDSAQVIARFEAERQALAMMDHPNIARVFDAGTTDGGRPFFVMELVKGIPLTDYCDGHRLGLLERLALFRQICSAVQHAHQKGIIHRDLKPSNILVESHDGAPVPRVIDFGLAKATSGLQLTEQSLFSAFGSVAGTPLYMAPEQASLSAIDVDTRADVYALGVILYELLAGSTPIERETFQRVAILEMLRIIRDEEPATPSKRISSSEALPSLAATRQTEPSRLGRFLRGDLDWIVMKALAKERQRRYESPIALSQDIERFLNHEPVSAGPPTAGYRFRKFVRRNRPQVVAASLVLLALVGGIIGTTLGLFEARRQTAEAEHQKQIAVAEAVEKEKARKAEATQRQQAEKRLTQIEKANEILGSIFKDLNPKNEEKDGKPLGARLGERLDAATAQIEGEAIGDPLTVARIQLTLGQSQIGLGYPEKAITLLTKARASFTAQLGADHPDTLRSMSNLAEGFKSAGKLDRALPLLEETLALSKTKLGADHPDTLASMNNLADCYREAGKLDRALPLLEETLALSKTKLGADHPDTLASMNNLAGGYSAVGQLDRARTLYEEILTGRKSRLGADHPDTLASMNNLAYAYESAGRLDRAIPLLEQSLALYKSRFGADHPDTLSVANNLAVGYQYAGKLDRALPLHEDLLARRKSRLGPDHPDTLMSMSNLATCYQNAEMLDRALTLYEETLALRIAKLGPDHPDSLKSATILARGYTPAGRLDRAVPLLEKTLVVQRSKLGPDHPDTLMTLSSLAVAYATAGKLDRALPVLEETLTLQRSKLGPDHPDTLMSMNNVAKGYLMAGQSERGLSLLEETCALARLKLTPDHAVTGFIVNNLANVYLLAGKLDRALPIFEERLALAKSKFGPDHPTTLKSMNNLARGYQVADRLDRALPLLREAAGLWKPKAGAYPRQYAETLAALGLNFLREKKWAEAEAVVREALTIQESKDPDAPTTSHTKSLLGGALLGQKKYAEAEPLLKAGYAGMKQQAEKIPQEGRYRLGDALDRLIELAEVRGKLDDARLWKDEKSKLPGASAPKPGVGKK